ncbi:uncharacterized protein LOC125032394 [Penaeus chinensis]|uniref:uncharacterized protein LOC125032394 n=1 Tax=Penaeus chinensis TaxID=139456 RepID=UPI001FB5E018|nr:uncharacterized protein LOC125032394 [Penaeus chinensis]
MDDSSLDTKGYDNTIEFISVKEERIEDVCEENCQEIKKEVISYVGEENAIFLKAENNISTSECSEIADVEADRSDSDVLMCEYEDPLKIVPFVVKDQGDQEAPTNFKEKVTHLTVDKKGKIFVCEVCCKTFSYNGHLLIHMRVHTKEKPYSCEVCSKAFSKKSHQVAHMRVHTKEKPYICKICSKAFSHKHHLEQHTRVHTKEKPYSCEECSKKFSQRDALVVHRRVHTKEKPYTCEVCCKAFSQKQHLEKHMRVHIKELREYLEEIRVPRRRLPLPLEEFELRDGLLYHVRILPERVFSSWSFPGLLSYVALQLVHKDRSDAHPGICRTHCRLRDRLYFPQMLAEVRKSAPNDWNDLLPYVRLALNTAVHRSISQKPLYLLTDRDCCFPGNLTNYEDEDGDATRTRSSSENLRPECSFEASGERSREPCGAESVHSARRDDLPCESSKSIQPRRRMRMTQPRSLVKDRERMSKMENQRKFFLKWDRLVIDIRTSGKGHPGNADLVSIVAITKMSQGISCKKKFLKVHVLLEGLGSDLMQRRHISDENTTGILSREQGIHNTCMARQSIELHVSFMLLCAVNTWRILGGQQLPNGVIAGDTAPYIRQYKFDQIDWMEICTSHNLHGIQCSCVSVAPNMESLRLDTKVHEDTIEFVSVEEKNIEGISKGNDQEVKEDVIDHVYKEDITFIKTEDDVNANECSVCKETEIVHVETIKSDSNILMSDYEDPLKVSEEENCKETLSDDLATHKETVEDCSLQVDGKGKRFMCVLCCKKYTYRYELLKHARVHTKERPYSCDICSYAFAEKRTLMRHMLVHTKEKPFNCEICGKPFSRKSEIKLHMRVHTKEKPYTCEICGKMFTMKGNLGIHMRIHTGEKPFSCERCNRAFCRKSDLIVHIRTHTKEKPYACEVCSKTFSEKGHLKSHMRVHTKERPYKCEVCYKAFSQKHHVEKHMGVHNKLKASISKSQPSERGTI